MANGSTTLLVEITIPKKLSTLSVKKLKYLKYPRNSRFPKIPRNNASGLRPPGRFMILAVVKLKMIEPMKTGRRLQSQYA